MAGLKVDLVLGRPGLEDLLSILSLRFLIFYFFFFLSSELQQPMHSNVCEITVTRRESLEDSKRARRRIYKTGRFSPIVVSYLVTIGHVEEFIAR